MRLEIQACTLHDAVPCRAVPRRCSGCVRLCGLQRTDNVREIMEKCSEVRICEVLHERVGLTRVIKFSTSKKPLVTY